MSLGKTSDKSAVTRTTMVISERGTGMENALRNVMVSTLLAGMLAVPAFGAARNASRADYSAAAFNGGAQEPDHFTEQKSDEDREEAQQEARDREQEKRDREEERKDREQEKIDRMQEGTLAAMTRSTAYAADLAASHLVLAVQRGGAVIATTGWIAVPDEAGTARIRKVFVHPDLARRGIASHLIRHAEARAEAAGYGRLIVRANINAVPLYRKLGYRTLREGEMDAGGGVVLPVHFMAKA